MHALIAWLNDNQTAVTATAAVVTALATIALTAVSVVYVIYTRTLAKENVLLRKAGTEPQVVAYAALSAIAFGPIDFVLANVGRGAARNVHFEVLRGAEAFGAKEVRLPIEMTFRFLPQDEKIRAVIGIVWELTADPPLRSFDVAVSYESMNGERYDDVFPIDVSQFNGLIRVSDHSKEKVVKALEEMATEMKQISASMKPN